MSEAIKRSMVTNVSFVNMYSPSLSATSTEEHSDDSHDMHVHHDSNRKLVHEIINDIFDERSGYYEVSSSHCSSLQPHSSEYSFDRRLQYWRNALDERRRIAEQIRDRTGKKSSDVLFNRLTTVDERDKQTVKRLIDFADRMNPITLRVKQRTELPAKLNMQSCKRMHAVCETLPRAEREQQTRVEITGLPAVTREEQLGRRKEQGCEKSYQWLRSKVLEQRIEEKREDIERVIEYYPDIDNLQIVGESLEHAPVMRHNSEIQLLHEEVIHYISSDSSMISVGEGEEHEHVSKCKAMRDLEQQEEAAVAATLAPEEERADYAVKINDQVFVLLTKRSSKNVNIEIKFQCEPFEKCTDRVMRLENIGRKMLNCEWVQRMYYEKTASLLRSCDAEFRFDRRPFRLTSGETRDIIVQYQPRKVAIVKERWLLKIDPQFFCKKMDGVLLRLSGRCYPPVVYVQTLLDRQRQVIDKSNLKMMTKLTTGLASITPLIQPNEVVCPYRRLLNERELFEFYNVGYTCERFHDLELLKELHKRLKKPREPAWDLHVETLKTFVLREVVPETRALLFAELMGLLEQMKGQPDQLFEEKVLVNPERDRTRMLYVRGIISTGIDEWEELMLSVEEGFMKPALKDYYERLVAEEEEHMADDNDDGAEEYLLVDEHAIRAYLIKKMYRRKAFRDALYMHTYSHLCNVVEDMVSVIESTEIV